MIDDCLSIWTLNKMIPEDHLSIQLIIIYNQLNMVKDQIRGKQLRIKWEGEINLKIQLTAQTNDNYHECEPTH